MTTTDGFAGVQLLAQELILEGFDVQQLMYQLLDHFIKSPSLSDVKKAKISEIVGETEIKVIQSGDEELNLLYALS